MALPATDNFDRADANPIGGNWSTIHNESAVKIVSNQILGSGAARCGAVWNADVFDDDQYSQVKGTQATFVSAYGVAVRAPTATPESYYYFAQVTSTVCRMQKIVAGTLTQIGLDYAHTYVQNDVLKLEVTGQDTDAVLTPYINGSAAGTRAGVANLNSGRAGVRFSNNNHSADDWEGGNVEAAPAAVPPSDDRGTFRGMNRGMNRGMSQRLAA